jgi:hypothetical protein
MARNFTRELRKAFRRGENKIVCSVAPWVDREMAYLPRGSHDPKPWKFAQDRDPNGYRFTGRECEIKTVRYAVRDCGRSFAVVDTHTGQYANSGIMSRSAAETYAERLEASHK